MMKHEAAILHDFWRRVSSWARKRSNFAPTLKLRIDCPLMLRMRKESPRAFMHAMHVPRTVCVASAAAGLQPEHLVGLFLHELGHPMAMTAWGTSEQEDADKAVRQFLGITLKYKGDLLLEWVPTRVMKRVLKG